ncbi:extracellular solute-binding protein [Streptomyces sp. VRA16 Mangrove soil]|uniref:extracellular solute-binding protein n=1 Tax=Streptomyces sp. VRA16 Mangrove soil TaxID=2817434 RepID=UPI001A9E4DFF|nr:extracellular solute-binding protein [Streptomyces sp. VRA16 Mangrove soil]MBO1334578.1 extracellular solute-binding protein [Streptomyces sp. VRA16 Mangrove soil]
MTHVRSPRTAHSLGSLIAVTGLLATGCNVLPGGDAGRTTVTVWLMRDSASDTFLKRFTKEFEAQHSDLKLDIRIQDWAGIGSKVTTALAHEDSEAKAAGAPDVIEVGNTQVPGYGDGNGLLDLSLESARDLGMDDWLPGLAEPAADNGRQFGIPWYAANRVVIYNKDLFAAADITKPPRTRDEWLDMTRRLDTGGRQGIYLAGQDWYTLSGFIWDEGGDLAVESSGNWTGTLDSPAALRGMAFYQQLQALGDGPVDADEEHPPQAERFAKGDVAQIIAVPGTVQRILQKNPSLKGKLGFFPVPGKTAARAGSVFTGGSDLVVPANTDARTGAVAVVEALAGKKWNTELARTMNYVPNKTKLAAAVADEPGVAAMAVGAAHGKATPASPLWVNVESSGNPIKAYMSRVLTGQDPKAVARKASREITRRLDESGE